MNSIILSGRVVKDCELRYSVGENQTAISKFSLAVPRKFGTETDFFNCKSFGKMAELHEQFLKRGIKVIVRGNLRNDSYKNKEGKNVVYTEVIVEDWEFAEKKATSNAATGSSAPTSGNSNADGFMNIPDGIDSEIPFV